MLIKSFVKKPTAFKFNNLNVYLAEDVYKYNSSLRLTKNIDIKYTRVKLLLINTHVEKKSFKYNTNITCETKEFNMYDYILF